MQGCGSEMDLLLGSSCLPSVDWIADTTEHRLFHWESGVTGDQNHLDRANETE